MLKYQRSFRRGGDLCESLRSSWCSTRCFKRRDRESLQRAGEKYHPDRYKDHPLRDLAEEKMKQINEAYAVLMSGEFSETPRQENVFNTFYSMGYRYRGNDDCRDILACLGCAWCTDTCCEACGGDCIPCM